MIVGKEVAAVSQLDSARFGIRVARALVDSDGLSNILDFCKSEKIELLIARCATNDLPAVQTMEAQRFLLMDTLVYYRFDLSNRPAPEDLSVFRVRCLRPEDTDRVEAIASAAFKGYMGHYHADRRLDRVNCDAAYASWAERSCTKAAADEVLVAEDKADIAGFGTLRVNSPREVEGLLFAVAPEFQRRGVCPSLMIRSLEWTRSRGAEHMIISTQITNVPMQKVWCRLGFEFSHAYYTFHRWFDE